MTVWSLKLYWSSARTEILWSYLIVQKINRSDRAIFGKCCYMSSSFAKISGHKVLWFNYILIVFQCQKLWLSFPVKLPTTEMWTFWVLIEESSVWETINQQNCPKSTRVEILETLLQKCIYCSIQWCSCFILSSYLIISLYKQASV